jgi:transcriptional regulator with XRE-family HTH domain
MYIVAKKTLRENRIKAGFSIEDLAKEIGMNAATVSYVENNKRHPSPASAQKICKGLQKSFDEIFEVREA